ncbi:tetratricopeptide repeat protein [Streptomyces axinellae]|uniref:non-specific serine/threonine protein kinase n=1 Tax=Streptomyces axinellae TaxID=552788 RepID=A0ABP6BYT2_9ACTN
MAEDTLIQGRYRLLDLIGRGGMGEVWRARDESLGRRVAVKCLKPLAEGGDSAFMRVLRERFRREARVAAALQHRGVTVVHDFGEHEGQLYLVMELLEGRNLSQLLEAGKPSPLPVIEVIEVAEQVAAALAYTHDQGVVHRDLKPANVMRTGDGTVKICDFGIARLAHDIGFTAKLTGTGIAMGTPHYMSPEQIAGATVDHRSDLYSLGCVLYELATAAPPFEGGDAWSVLVGHRDTTPAPPRARRPELPGPLEHVILGLLAKDPDQRPYSATALAPGLRAARAGTPGGGHAAVTAMGARSGHLTRLGAAPASSRTPVQHPARVPGVVSVPAHLPATVPARPPAWSEGICGGSRASGAWSAVETAAPASGAPEGERTSAESGAAGAPGALSALTGPWTGPHGAGRPAPVAVPGQGGPPAISSARHRAVPPAPSRELLAVLAERHGAGLGLGRLGRWEEAHEVHRAVAAERELALGPGHPDTLASRYETGFALSRLGRHREALEEYTRVASERGATLGREHPDTLAARQETAYVLGQLGRYLEAHELYAAVLAARERTMGPDHPDTLRCRHNLAFNLSRLGRPADSYELAAEVARARARVLGAGHPDTLVTRYEVGYALGRLGRWAEALETYLAVAALRGESLGPDHPDTLAARYESGVCLGRLGRPAEALELYRDLALARARVQGRDHPETLRALHGLGVNLGRLGRWPQALTQAREVCEARERVLGPEHPDTLVSHREVAVALGWLGRWEEALKVYGYVADVRERVLGPADPGTLASRNDEAHCLEQLTRSIEAAGAHR